MKKFKVGMVGGGGPNNFFGAPHRRAILMDNTAELWCGALRSDPKESVEEAQRLGFICWSADYAEMFAHQAGQARDEKMDMDYVTIVTPNSSHYAIAKCALEHGFPVLCEKPLTMVIEEAKELVQLARSKGLPFQVAYTYTGYPMVMLAREMVLIGAIGDIRKVQTWYPQGWLHQEETFQQAAWRTNPSIAGLSGCGGDIGSHAYEFIRFVCGLTATRVQAHLTRFVKGRRLDDDFEVFAELDNGAVATVSASQVTIGAENDCGFRVIGTRGTIGFSNANGQHTQLRLIGTDGVVNTYRLGANYGLFPESIKPYLRLPCGLPNRNCQIISVNLGN